MSSHHDIDSTFLRLPCKLQISNGSYKNYYSIALNFRNVRFDFLFSHVQSVYTLYEINIPYLNASNKTARPFMSITMIGDSLLVLSFD